ncbi:hypothetical protein [Streptosporangium jomthongense]|uniref:DUF1737 domain-containing protein n=1 Tax=Streptosporangium jomthongense TaxID=1193683 RepID=A0ABV8FGY3_9ACTN
MSESPSPITLRVTVAGDSLEDLAHEALSRGWEFFGDDAEVCIVSGEATMIQEGPHRYTACVVVRQVGTRPPDDTPDDGSHTYARSWYTRGSAEHSGQEDR